MTGVGQPLVSCEYVHLPCNVVSVSCPCRQLDVHIQGDEFRDFKKFAIMYSYYFRLMCTNLNTKFLNTLPLNREVIVLLQIEDVKPQVFTPKLLKRDAITIPEAIELEAGQPTSIEKTRQKIDIGQILEEHFGRVLLRFCSFREPTDPPGASTAM